MELRRKPRGEKICRGAYNYFKRDTLYAEEEFEFYKDRKELTSSLFAYLYARVPTGELLTTYVDYVISKDYMPQNLYIERTLGKNVIQENYAYSSKDSTITYNYKGPKKQEQVVITAPSKFSFTTPTTSTSMTFLRSKKEDTVGKNYYSLVGSDNNWSFEGEPYAKVVVMERVGIGQETLMIDGKNLQSTPYKLYDGEDLSDEKEAFQVPHLQVHLSKVATVPYLIKSDDGTKIQIKYLTDFDAG